MLLAACDTEAPTPAPTATPAASPVTPEASTTPPASPTPTPTPAASPRGVSISPRSFDSEDFLAFLGQLEDAGGHLRWAGPWAQLGDSDSGAAAVAGLSLNYGYRAVIETGVYSVSTRSLHEPLTDEVMDRYVRIAAEFAERHRPAYLGIGVEVNIHREDQPDEFAQFVDLFDRAYDAVKAVAPDTAVYTNFQLERMKGLHGGLWGGEDDPAESQWDLLDLFPKSDLFAFTTFPGLNFRAPPDIPDDYYAEIRLHTQKPVAFTELGWTHETVAPGWESSEEAQVEFVERLLALTEPLAPDLLIWLWMYGQPTAETAFAGMTLFRDDGSPRPVWDAWISGP